MAKGKLTPPFRSPLMTHINDSRAEVAQRIALEEKKLALTERRTAVMERQIEQRAAQPTREVKPLRPSADFAARRAEIEAILDNARAEIADQLLELCDRWRATSSDRARCCADVTALAQMLHGEGRA